MKNKNNVLVTVRTKSSRLPEKCLLPFGNQCVLEHVIERCKLYKLEPIICTSIDPSDDRIVDIAKKYKVNYFRGSVVNKLLRWRDCCRKFNLNYFHSVDADDPFFCGEEVLRSLDLFHSGNYDIVTPSPSSSNGGATVGYSLSRDIIEDACEGLADDTDTEMMWTYIDRLKKLNKASLDDPIVAIITQRMTLDYHEDYILLESVRLMLKHQPSRTDIYKLFQDNPNLSDINSFRNEEWAVNQKNKMFKET